MIIKLIILTFVTSLSASMNSTAQDFFTGEIEWGQPQERRVRDMNIELLGPYEGKVALVKYNQGNTIIEEYKHDTFETIGKHELDLSYEKKKLTVEAKFIFGDKLVFITSFLNKISREMHYFIHYYLSEGQLTKPENFATVNWENATSKTSMSRIKSAPTRFAFKYSISPDQNILLLMLPDKIASKKDNLITWNTFLYETDINQTTASKIELKTENIFIDEIKVSNEGILFCSAIENIKVKMQYGNSFGPSLINAYPSNEYLTDNITGEHYHCIILDIKSDNLEIINLDFTESNIISYSMELIKNEIVFYGLTGTSSSRSEGIVIKKLNSNGEVIFEVEEAIEAPYERDVPKLKQASFGSLILKDLIISDNGDFALMAEEFKPQFVQHGSNKNSSSNPGSASRSTPRYDIGDILAIRCSSEGIISWTKRIEKAETTSMNIDFSVSYYAMFQGDELLILMNSTERNVFKAKGKPEDEEEEKDTPVIAITKIGIDGNIIYDILIKEDEDNHHNFAPRNCLWIEQSLFFIGFDYNHQRAGGLNGDYLTLGKFKAQL